MNNVMKPLAVLGLAGAMALGAMSPSEARSGRWAAAGAGFAAGALVGAAAANAAAPRASYYYDDYAYAPAPSYYGSYSYEPAYVDSYAYEPAYPRYRTRYKTDRMQHLGAGGTGTSDY